MAASGWPVGPKKRPGRALIGWRVLQRRPDLPHVFYLDKDIGGQTVMAKS